MSLHKNTWSYDWISPNISESFPIAFRMIDYSFVMANKHLKIYTSVIIKEMKINIIKFLHLQN